MGLTPVCVGCLTLFGDARLGARKDKAQVHLWILRLEEEVFLSIGGGELPFGFDEDTVV